MSAQNFSRQSASRSPSYHHSHRYSSTRSRREFSSEVVTSRRSASYHHSHRYSSTISGGEFSSKAVTSRRSVSRSPSPSYHCPHVSSTRSGRKFSSEAVSSNRGLTSCSPLPSSTRSRKRNQCRKHQSYKPSDVSDSKGIFTANEWNNLFNEELINTHEYLSLIHI